MDKVQFYSNRKFYSPAKRDYVTLGEMQKWFLEGTPFRVYCHKTKNDITEQTLTRAVAHARYKEVYERFEITK